MLDVVSMHQLHFTLRDAVKDFFWKCHDEPCEGSFYYQMDFLEHKTLPMGPDESSDWWYATNVLGLTVLVIYVWSKGKVPAFHVYCSHCRDQSAAFVIACLRDLHNKLNVKAYSRHVMFADVGSHFRNGYTLNYWCKEMLALQGICETDWIHFPEGHGKGMCDAQGGRMTSWFDIILMECVRGFT